MIFALSGFGTIVGMCFGKGSFETYCRAAELRTKIIDLRPPNCAKCQESGSGARDCPHRAPQVNRNRTLPIASDFYRGRSAKGKRSEGMEERVDGQRRRLGVPSMEPYCETK